MISSIQRIFHTDKWWGKAIFVVFIYFIYWSVFYGSLSLLPEDTFLGHNENIGYLLIFYVLILAPVLSFLIPFFCKKIFNKKGYYLYILNIIFIILSIILFFYIDLSKSVNSWFSF